jgi:hypothetical protein
LVSYVPFQILKFNDQSLDGLKRIDVVEKTLEDEKIAGASISTYNKQHGSQEGDEVGILFMIGRHRWDVDHTGLFMRIPSMT